MNASNFRHRRNVLKALGAGALLALGPSSRAAEAYPSRPITFICPWPAGGTADVTMRALCTAAARALGGTIVLENRTGAAGMIGAKALASAKPDGYTVGQIPLSVTRFSQLGMVALDPLKDYSYIARTSAQTFGVAVRSDAPWKTMQQFVAHAKANPGKVTYSHSGIGGQTHVGMEEFAMAAGVVFNNIPYKGGAEALTALMGGHVDAIADSSSWAPHVEQGKLRLLCTWGEQRAARFKDTPTLKDLGYKVVVDAPNGVGAPHGVDAQIAAKLREAFRQACASEEFRQACDKIDAPVMYLDGPDYEKYIVATYRKETMLIERLKLKELLKS